MGDISKYFSHEKDIMYKYGRAKGREEGWNKASEKRQEEFVRNLLDNTDFSDQRIAVLAGVSAEYVEHVRKQIGCQSPDIN